MIYTIGYQRLKVERLDYLMDLLKIDALIDVRSVPKGRRHEFNMAALAKRYGARYEWRGQDLGGRGEGPTPQGLASIEAETRTVMLMCMEEAPAECHRFTRITTPLDRADVFHVYRNELIQNSSLVWAIFSNTDYDYDDLPEPSEI